MFDFTLMTICKIEIKVNSSTNNKNQLSICTIESTSVNYSAVYEYTLSRVVLFAGPFHISAFCIVNKIFRENEEKETLENCLASSVFFY